MRFKVVLLLGILLVAGSAFAVQNLFVSPTGTGSTCSQAAPCSLATVDSVVAPSAAGACVSATNWEASFGINTSTGFGACIHLAASATGYAGAFNPAKNGTAGARIRYVSDTLYGARIVGNTSNGVIFNVQGSFTDVIGVNIDGTVNGSSNNFGFTFNPPGSNGLFGWSEVHDTASSCNTTNNAAVQSTALSGGASVSSSNDYESLFIFHNNCGKGHSTTAGNADTGLSMQANDIVRNPIIVDQGGGYCLQATHSSTHVIVSGATLVDCDRNGLIIDNEFGSGVNDFSTFTNIIVANNGQNGGGSGIRCFSNVGTHNLFAGIVLFGNVPSQFDNSGCPGSTIVGQQTGSNSTTFSGYTGTINDTATAYQLKAGSTAAGNGSTTCASGVTNCAPTRDFSGAVRPGSLSIGAFDTGGAAPISVLTITPSTINFGNVQVGTNASQSATLSNNNVGSVTISSAVLAGSAFSVTPASPCIGSLAAGASCPAFSIKFTPPSAGPFSGTLTFNNTAGAFSDSFSSGTLNPAVWTIDTGNSPAPGTGNTGTFSAANVDLTQGVLGLKLTQVAGSPIVSTGAEVRSLNSFGYGTYSCTMRASSTALTPGGAGSQRSGSVSSCFSFINNSQTEIDSPEFEGQGAPSGIPGCTVGQVCAEFTNFNGVTHSTNLNSPVATGDTAFHVYTWIWSPMSIVYQVDGVTVGTSTTNIPSAPAFIIFNHYGTNSGTFGGLATTGVTRWQYISNFSFTPAGALAFSGVGTVPGGRVQIPTPPTGLNFGAQQVNTASGPQGVNYQNIGTAPLTFSSIVANGDFSIVPGTNTCPVAPATLAVAGTCGLSMIFTPTIVGTRNGTLSFNSNDPLSPQTVALTGIGQQGVIPPTGIVFQQGVIGAH